MINPDTDLFDEDEFRICRLRENVLNKNSVLREALTSDDDIQVNIKSIFDSCESMPIDPDEIKRFECNGNLGIFETRLSPPIHWPSVVGLTLLGVGQIFVGCLLTFLPSVFGASAGAILSSRVAVLAGAILPSGFGASAGSAMIAEGISDICTCIVDGVIRRNFNWTNWIIKKALFYQLFITSAAIGITFKVIASTFDGIIQKDWPEVGKTIWDKLKKKGEYLIKPLTNFVAKRISKRVITTHVNFQIRKSLQKNKNINGLLAIDSENGNNLFQSMIIDRGNELLRLIRERHITPFTPNMTFYEKDTDSVVDSITEFIGSLSDAIDSIYSNHLQFQMNAHSESAQTYTDNSRELSKCLKTLTTELSESLISTIYNLNQHNLLYHELSSERQFGAENIRMVNCIEFPRIAPTLAMDKNDRIGKKPKTEYLMTDDDASFKTVHEMISDLENGGEAGLVHLDAVAEAIVRPIAMYNEQGRFFMMFGTHLPGNPISLQLHQSTSSRLGQWKPFRVYEPLRLRRGNTDSLFRSIEFLTGTKRSTLRSTTVAALKKADIAANIANDKNDKSRAKVRAKRAQQESRATTDTKCETTMYKKNIIGQLVVGSLLLVFVVVISGLI